MNGESLTQTFGIKEQLSAVRLYIELNRTDGDDGSFSLMTTFPRKVFVEDDYDKPLDVLGMLIIIILTICPFLFEGVYIAYREKSSLIFFLISNFEKFIIQLK